MFKTIRSRLFISYTGITAAVILVFAAAFYNYTADILEKRASQSLQQLAINVNQYLDAEFRNMSATANRVISSEPIKAVFYDSQVTEAEFMRNRWNLFQLLFTVTGSSTANQINLIGSDGTVAQFGKRFDLLLGDEDVQASLPGWYDHALSQEGRYTITSPHLSELPPQDRTVVSVCRAFNQLFGAPYDAIVEVQEDYDNLVRIVETAISLPDNQSNPGVHAVIFDGSGQVVYPLDAPGTAQQPDTAQDYGILPMERADGRDIMAYATSGYSGWTVTVRQPEEILLAPVTDFRNSIIAMGVVVLAVTIGITYVIARQLTEPIRTIRQSISTLELADLSAGEPGAMGRSAYELTTLNQAYISMVHRLEESLEETVTARSHEIRARMLALQAQMNPHFLYNTITIISIKAEEQGDDTVVEMCRCLTGMLRYVAQETVAPVPLRTELDYLNQYLYLMQCRYPGQFSCTVLLPDPLLDVPVPRLILQPLVENCFKHAFNIRELWEITLRGSLDGDCWRLEVQDNGVGFDAQTLARLTVQLADDAPQDSREEAQHIGLLNIAHRLRLQYRGRAVFTVENLWSGGCRVTIGGAV